MASFTSGKSPGGKYSVCLTVCLYVERSGWLINFSINLSHRQAACYDEITNAGFARNPILRKECVTITGTVPDDRGQETGVRDQ